MKKKNKVYISGSGAYLENSRTNLVELSLKKQHQTVQGTPKGRPPGEQKDPPLLRD